MKKYLYISMILASLAGSLSVYADDSVGGFPDDSTSIGPQTKTQELGSGYVLGTGTYEVYCNGNSRFNENCNATVTTNQCPIGYTPQVTVSPVWSTYRASNSLRGYFLSQTASSPQDEGPSGPMVPVNNGRGGYSLPFTLAYADYIGSVDQYMTISYTVDCLPQS